MLRLIIKLGTNLILPRTWYSLGGGGEGRGGEGRGEGESILQLKLQVYKASTMTCVMLL